VEFKIIEKHIELFDELIPQFQILYPDKPCVIAGGCVRDFMLGNKAKDIDIYFLGLDWRKETKEEFNKKLNASQIYYKISGSNLPWHKYERYLLLSIIKEISSNLAKENMEIQFMGFPTNSIEGLLKTFDWEICLFGYQNGRVITTNSAMELIEKIKKYNVNDKNYKPPKMKLNNVQFPISNLRRGFGFEGRYPIKLDYPSVLKLCKAVISEDTNSKKEKGE